MPFRRYFQKVSAEASGLLTLFSAVSLQDSGKPSWQYRMRIVFPPPVNRGMDRIISAKRLFEASADALLWFSPCASNTLRTMPPWPEWSNTSRGMEWPERVLDSSQNSYECIACDSYPNACCITGVAHSRVLLFPCLSSNLLGVHACVPVAVLRS